MEQIRSTSTTTDTEELKAKIVEKLKDLHDYFEGLHASIQSTICPTEYGMDVNVNSLDINSLRAISRILANNQFPNLDISFSPGYFPTELIHFTTNYIQSKSTTLEDQSLGHFTRRKLKRLYTWYEREQCEINQLNQMHDLGMFGKPIDPPNNAIYL